MAKAPKGFIPFEKGGKDKKMDARKGAPKEGSKADMKADMKGSKGKMPMFARGGKVGRKGC